MDNPKDLQSALKQSEDRFRILFEGIEDAVIVYEVLENGNRGLITDVNEATCTRLGYTREELLTMTIEDIDAPESAAQRLSFAERYGQQSSARFEVVHKAKDGTGIPVEISARKFMLDGRTLVLAIARDISIRKKTERLQNDYLKRLESEVAIRTAEMQTVNISLKQQAQERRIAEKKALGTEKNIKGLLDASTQSIILIELDGTIIHVNTTAARGLDSTPEEMTGKNIFSYINNDLAQSRHKFLTKVINDKCPVKFKDIRNGIPIFHTLFPILENGLVQRVAIYAEDLSKELLKERELEQSRQIRSVLYEIISHSQSFNSLEELLQSIHRIMIKELGAENFYVALIDEERELLKFEYCIDKIANYCPTVHEINSPEAKNISLLPIKQNAIIHLTKADIQYMIDSGQIDVHGIVPEAWVGVPLRLRGKVIGVLVIQEYDRPGSYAEEAIRIFSACSDQIAIAIERKQFDMVAKSEQDIFNNIPSGLFIYQYTSPDSLKLLEANPSALKMTGINLTESRGVEFLELWPGSKEQGIYDRFILPLTTGKDFVSGDISYKSEHLQGAYRLHTFTLPNDRIGVAFEDITEQKDAEAAMRESEEQYRAFFENNHSVMFIIAPESGQILDTNKAAEKFYGFPREILKSKIVQELNSQSPARVANRMHAVKDQKLSRFITKHKLADGSIRDVEVFSGPFQLKGKTRLISIVHDISERIANEKELSEAKEAAVYANKTKDEFIANISHEIRTPLNGVMGMLQLLKVSSLDSEQHSCVDVALQSSRNLLRVLDDILDFSKMEVGRIDLYEEPFNLEPLLEQSINLFRLQAISKNIDLACEISKGAAGCYHGDEGRIRQILFNLLGNALKFTESGSIHIKVDSTAILTQNRKQLHFTVTDTGIGIPEDKIESIFNSFTQVDGSLSRKYNGVGLGLAIVKSLINIMDGSISIASKQNSGTSIKFSIPFEMASTKYSQTQEYAAVAKSDEPLKIMLVEDEMVNRIMACKMLEKMGHVIVCAENGRECLTMLSKESVDLILMDIQMPILDGLQTTRIIRTSDDFKQFSTTPIIALTAHATHQNMESAAQAGMDAYISKPFEWGQLERVLYDTVFPG